MARTQRWGENDRRIGAWGTAIGRRVWQLHGNRDMSGPDEQNEEEFVFPRLQDHHQQTELVTVLFQQHRKGRELTRQILAHANAGKTDGKLAGLLRAFTRIYRPHAAGEETVLFPAFRKLIGKQAYRDLGEKFEDDEHRRFGDHGFEATVKQIASLEQQLGIYELAGFSS